MNRYQRTFSRVAFIALASAFGGAIVNAQPLASHVTLSTAFNAGYATGGINAVAINRDTLTTDGDYQYIAFYDSNSVRLGRRPVGTNNWTVFDTGFTPAAITDDHDNVAIAIDGDGYMHMSWGMHNNTMNYRVSTAPVNGATWGAGATNFVKPAFWAGTAATVDNLVTYPEFYRIPFSKDLLFAYRQGGTGGGSGNGDEYFVRYDAATKVYYKSRAINGIATSVNAYLNNLAYDSTGKLHMSWTWRSTPAFQTNHNIMYASSMNNGKTWSKSDGTPYALPITEGQGGVIAAIPEHSTLINQTSMTVDRNDNPIIATWYAPGASASPANHTRQYMLHYFDGLDWKKSQITNRPNEAKQGDSTVRELARPIVMVDDDNRVFVVMRYKEVNDSLVVAFSDNRQTWTFLTLSTADLGNYEPSYDVERWQRDNVLSLFYQPVGLGFATSAVSVLEWDTKAYFASLAASGNAFNSIPEPTTLALLLPALWLRPRRERSR